MSELKDRPVIPDDSKLETYELQIDPKKLKLLDVNARYMKNDMFRQLVKNIKKDGRLTAYPLCVLEDDGRYKVLSGNHRVQAGIAAGLTLVTAIVTDQKLSEQRQTSLQLSHNSIEGEDDPAVLKQLYESITDLDLKSYAGLDDKTLDLMEKVSPASLSEFKLQFANLTFLFLPEEMDAMKVAFDEARAMIKPDSLYLARYSDYETMLDALDAAGSAYDVKNVATTLAVILAVFNEHKTDLATGFLDQHGEVLHARAVPISTLFATDKVSPVCAKSISIAIKKALKNGDAEEGKLILLLNKWADDYLVKCKDIEAADYMKKRNIAEEAKRKKNARAAAEAKAKALGIVLPPEEEVVA